MTSNALATVEAREAHPIVVGIQQRMPAIRSMLPPGMDEERFMAVTIQAIVKNPDILACTPESVITAIIEAAQDGLEPTGARGGAHLVKFGNEAVLIRDYRGVIRIVIESRAASRVDARPVRHGDEFALDYASPDPVTHKPLIPPTGEVYGYYALFWLHDGTKQAEFMTVEDIEHTRAQSRGKDSLGWTKFFDQMARKTVIKRGANYLNLRPDIRERLMREDQAEYDGQIISVERDERLAGARSRIHERTARLTGGEPAHPDQPSEGETESVAGARPAGQPDSSTTPRAASPAPSDAPGQAGTPAEPAHEADDSPAQSRTPEPGAGDVPPSMSSPAASPTTMAAAQTRVGNLAVRHRLIDRIVSDEDWTRFDDVLRMLDVGPLPLVDEPPAVAEWNALGDRIEMGEFDKFASDPDAKCPEHGAPWKWVPPGTNQTTKKAYNGFFCCSGDGDCKARPSDAWRRANKPTAVPA
ncbi:MAG TPA: recombinase RecT [Candidatus Limnocylindrales bacterium]|nr:recombinase RecT [Candidatus Limnocylindrales bacterium]